VSNVGYCSRHAILAALKLYPADCIAYARQHSCRNWTEWFASLLEPFEEYRWDEVALIM
jgi:hypothetical protein